MKLLSKKEEAFYRTASIDEIGEEEFQRLVDLLFYLQKEKKESDHSSKLQWDCDMRAIKTWREANPDPANELIWPDKGKLMGWLMDRLLLLQKVAEEARKTSYDTPHDGSRGDHDLAYCDLCVALKAYDDYQKKIV